MRKCELKEMTTYLGWFPFSCCYIFALKSKFSGAFSLLEASFNNPSLECFQISLQPTFTFSTLSHLLLISSHSTFTFSLSGTILSLPLLFPPFSHSRLTIAVADLVMCPFFPFCSWQILYFLFFVNAIKFISRSGLHMDNFCPLSNPFQHECISAPSTVFIQPNYWEKLLPSPCTCAIWM